MAPKCKWCGEAQAHRKSALARIALAFVESDLESSKYEVAPTWEVRKGASSYKDLCKTCISEEGTYPGHSIANKLQDGGQHIITMCRKGKDVIVRREQLDTFIETEIELVAKPDGPKYLVIKDDAFLCEIGLQLSEIVQAWLPTSLSVNPNTASLTTCEYISTNVTAASSPQFRRECREKVRASNLLDQRCRLSWWSGFLGLIGERESVDFAWYKLAGRAKAKSVTACKQSP